MARRLEGWPKANRMADTAVAIGKLL